MSGVSTKTRAALDAWEAWRKAAPGAERNWLHAKFAAKWSLLGEYECAEFEAVRQLLVKGRS
jgi:hypothetical protein